MQNAIVVCPNKAWHHGKKRIYRAVFLNKLYTKPDADLIVKMLGMPSHVEIVWREKLCPSCRKEIENVNRTSLSEEGGA